MTGNFVLCALKSTAKGKGLSFAFLNQFFFLGKFFVFFQPRNKV